MIPYPLPKMAAGILRFRAEKENVNIFRINWRNGDNR
jgi:hypothetical protein